MPEVPDGNYTLRIETRNLHEIAWEEIASARATGTDPMDLANTHLNLGRLIPWLISQEAAGREAVQP